MMGSQLSGSYKKTVSKTKKRLVRSGIVVSNIAVLALVMVLVFGGSSNTNNPSQASVASESEQVNPLDELSSADIAVHLANMAKLDETTAVINNADSFQAQLSIVPSDSQVVAKPQIINTALKSKRDIKTHTVKQGDTLAGLVQAYGVTSDSIRWSNNISGNDLPNNLDVSIPPVNGIVYVVKAGDTPQKLAETYHASVDQIIAFNDAEVNGLTVGEKIVIPDGRIEVRVARSATSSVPAGVAVGFRPTFGGNGYDYGWCTWHAANRRAQTGRPIPTNFGNANTWLRRAQGGGFDTGKVPRAGAVLFHHDIGGLGHVAYVEKDNGDGTFLVSDMNYPSWGRVTYRNVSAADTGKYSYIY